VAQPWIARIRVAGWGNLIKFNRPIVALLLLRWLGGMMVSPHRTFFPVYARELGYSVILISTLAMVERLMGLLAALVGGTLSDARGHKWTLVLGYAGLLAADAIFVAPSLGWIVALWAVGGAATGLSNLGGQSYLIDAAPVGYLGLFTAFYGWGYTLGGTLSSPLAGVILDRWDYTAFAAALAVLGLAAVAVSLFALPRSSASRGSSAAMKKLLGYGDIATRPAIVVLVILRFLPTFYWGLATILIPLLLDEAQANKTTIALYATISQVFACLAQILVGRAADRFGGKWPAVASFSLLVASVAGIGLLPGRIESIVAFGTLGTAAAWALATLNPVMVSQVSAPHERGRVLGWVHLWWNLAMIVGSIAGGILFERWIGLPFLVAGAMNLPALALTFVFYRMAARTPLESPA
jgi:MFS family permease